MSTEAQEQTQPEPITEQEAWCWYRHAIKHDIKFGIELEKMSKDPKHHEHLMGYFEVNPNSLDRSIRRKHERRLAKMQFGRGVKW